jgi:hypothetical protein
MTAPQAYNNMPTVPARKRKRTASICSAASDANLDWDELTEVLWECMLPHVRRMAAVNAAEENNPVPSSPGRSFTMPWKAIWERFIELTGADVGRRSIQARGRTLISKRHKGERRHRWSSEEDDELLRAYDAVVRQCLNRGEAPVADMDDKEKTAFWDTVYNCTTVRRTKKSMRERHLILEARASSGESVHTSSSSGSPYLTAVKSEHDMDIEPLTLSTPCYFGHANNYDFLQPITVKEEDLRSTVVDRESYFEIAQLMKESWGAEDSTTDMCNNYNYNNEDVQLFDSIANGSWNPLPITC